MVEGALLPFPIAIMGRAKKLLRSHLAEPGDELVFAADLSGQLETHIYNNMSRKRSCDPSVGHNGCR
jgi:selenophosphate synthetase-related protein